MQHNTVNSKIEFSLQDFFESHSQIKERNLRPAISFEVFTSLIQNNPKYNLLNIFQFFS